MRWLTLFVLILMPTLARAQDGEAEKVYRAMEKKILAAKSLVVEFKLKAETKVDGKNQLGFTLEGTCHVAAGNKVRFELVQDFPALKSKSKILSVTSGESVYQKVGDDVLKKSDPPQKTKSVLGVVSRIGVGAAFMEKKLQTFDSEKDTPVKNLKLGKKEMVGNRETQVVEYQLEDNDAKKPDVLAVSVWIDAKTHLPLKRVQIATPAVGESLRITETYSAFTVDSKLDAKLFDVPKK